MFKVRMLDDGSIMEGQSWEELIDQMRLSKRLGPDPDLKTFMAGIKRRAKVWNGSKIRVNSFKNFILDLEAGGFLEILEGDK